MTATTTSTPGSVTVTQVVAPASGAPGQVALRQVQQPPPGPGELVVSIRAIGVNPTDWKTAERTWPRTEAMVLGFEAAGVVAALGLDVDDRAVGDEVIVYPVLGAYASAVVVAATDVLAKPATLGFAQAANLLLAGTTAAEMVHVTRPTPGATVVVHGASGATGISLLQQLGPLGVRVLGTASARNAELVESFGAEPIAYGPGLRQRLRAAAADGVDAALDCAGSEEAITASLALVNDRTRIVTVVNREAAARHGLRFLDGYDPASRGWRDGQRQRLVDLAGAGALVVPLARTFPLTDAAEALALNRSGHPGGKLALIP